MSKKDIWVQCRLQQGQHNMVSYIPKFGTNGKEIKVGSMVEMWEPDSKNPQLNEPRLWEVKGMGTETTGAYLREQHSERKDKLTSVKI